MAEVTITDDEMHRALAGARDYTFVVLRRGPEYDRAPDELIWEHGRRNLTLRADGRLAIVCPSTDDTDAQGICIFALSPAETDEVMAGDPAVMAGAFTYELHPCRGFPGDALP